MRLNTKTTLFSIGLMAVMVVTVTLVSLISFRQFSIISAKEHTRTAAEIIRVNLTESMVNGVINKRKEFLSRLAQIEGLKAARVVRGPKVVAQFGAGLDRETPQDSIEREVLQSGKPYFALIEDGPEPLFRSTIPFIANTKGNPNCLQCHQVPEGTVLGAVTLTISIAHLKHNALLTIVAMVCAVAVFALLSLLFFRAMIRPLVKTAGEVQEAVNRSVEGDFSSTLNRRTDDEVGQIAEGFNRLAAYLDDGLGKIRTNVAQLMRSDSHAEGNMLTATMEMVEGLVEVAHFKQAIEEDETKHEVYVRLSRVLMEEFAIRRFSIYEVAASKNRMIPIMVDGEAASECRWCDPQILIRSSACRAARTGHDIDAVESPMLCNAFVHRSEEQGYSHICLPVIQSGSVGSVVQLVLGPHEAQRVHTMTTLVKAYLREAAPVIEAKRLMDTLRESNLRDAMTGLHNRRFLEEFVDTMVASANRRKASLSILMLDLDYFKKVNDTYGHNVGDTVLKELSKVLRQTVRTSDLVIRYGGEEFMVILQDTVSEDGMAVAEKIRESVEKLKVQIPGGTLQKTISIGVSDFPDDGDTLWQVIKFADVALYKAKEQGRNRVVHFSEEMWSDDSDY